MVLYCPQCGNKLSDNANYCLYCGKPIRVAERTGLPTAGGVLAIIAACISIVKGIIFLWAYISARGYYYSYNEAYYVSLASIGVSGLIAFTSGLAGGILALKRQKFRSAMAAIAGMILFAIVSVIASFADYYMSLWPLVFIFEAPAFVLSVLSAIFIGTKRGEFLLTRQPTPRLPSLPTPSRMQPAVRCPNCGHNNPNNFKFCGKCGNPLGREETEIY